MRPRLLLVVFFASLLGLTGAGSAHAAFPGANGKIAFSAYTNPGSGQPQSYLAAANPDGTGIVHYTDGSTPDVEPAWSPDGSTIAFTRAMGPDPTYQGHQNEIWTLRVADGVQTRLTNNDIRDMQPAWSPDGSKIVFASDRDGGSDQLYTMNADGTNPVRLTNSATQDREPAWSPDGQTIAFQRPSAVFGGGAAIYEVPADGSGAAVNVSVPGANTYDEFPDWSPDGRKIAFDRIYTPNDDYIQNIWAMNADGTNQVKLTIDIEFAYWDEPTWSPDGKKIAMHSSSVNIMNADGSGGRPQVANGGFAPDWQRIPVPSYPHPQTASQLNLSLVPAFKPCGTGGNPSNAKHAPPLATNSCNPPKPSVLAAVGGSSQSSAQMSVTPGDTDPTNGNQANVSLSASLTDIQAVAGGDYNPNASGPDLTAVTRLRVTDKANGYGGLPATATEYDFKVPIDCSSTPDPSVGSTCSANTTANALIAGLIQEQRQTIVQTFRVRIDDSGANGIRGDSDDRIFATQGVFVP